MFRHPEATQSLSDPVGLLLTGQPENTWENFVTYFSPLAISHDLVGKRFNELMTVWKQDIKFLSNTNEICTHPAYQQIIGMGPLALPHILRQLRQDMAPWFWALKAITGFDPVPEEDMGRIRKMAQHWIHWGKRHGYV